MKVLIISKDEDQISIIKNNFKNNNITVKNSINLAHKEFIKSFEFNEFYDIIFITDYFDDTISIIKRFRYKFEEMKPKLNIKKKLYIISIINNRVTSNLLTHFTNLFRKDDYFICREDVNNYLTEFLKNNIFY